MKLLTIILLAEAGLCEAFSSRVSFRPKTIALTTTTTTLLMTRIKDNPMEYPKAEFERAVQCSGQFGLCDIDELQKLADQLEQYQGCFFEDKHDNWLCEKEEADRSDVAEVLRLQAELRLRMDYLQKANLFKEDVEESRCEQEREELMEEMSAWGTD